MRSTWWRDESELDDQQKEVIRLEVDESPILITGQPGAGKTNLALLRANYLILSGLPRTVVLTMGKVISNFIFAGAELHGLQKHNVMTFHAWAKRLVANAGGTTPEDADDYEVDLMNLVGVLRDLADGDNLESFDAIILDEAQDYPKGASRIFTHVTDRLFITGDQDQQIHRKTQHTMREFEKLATRKIKLDYHYRNGLAICRLAGAFRGRDYAATSRYDEEANPSRFERSRCASFREQVFRAIAMIPNQLAAYPDDLVGLIVPTNEQLDEMMKHVDASDIADQVQLQHSKRGYPSLDMDKRVIALNAFNSKGLEFRSAHFLGVDAMYKWPENTKSRNLVFTAVTRAKSSLDIYHTGDLPNWIESPILNVTSKPKPPSKFSAIFPKVPT
jgi:DNA helicase IV